LKKKQVSLFLLVLKIKSCYFNFLFEIIFLKNLIFFCACLFLENRKFKKKKKVFVFVFFFVNLGKKKEIGNNNFFFSFLQFLVLKKVAIVIFLKL
jgi:hypothetical protein